MNFSYDYDELLNELKSDLFEGLITPDSKIKIVRDKSLDSNYFPIIDYYYEDNEPKEEYEETSVIKVVKEMEYYNKIIKQTY